MIVNVSIIKPLSFPAKRPKIGIHLTQKVKNSVASSCGSYLKFPDFRSENIEVAYSRSFTIMPNTMTKIVLIEREDL